MIQEVLNGLYLAIIKPMWDAILGPNVSPIVRYPVWLAILAATIGTLCKPLKYVFKRIIQSIIRKQNRRSNKK